MNKVEELREIAEEIVASDVCPELRKGATQLVFGDGNPDAEVVFIGEAPGKKEDQSGLPFVGSAGKFLNEMLQLGGLRREDVYITNIVKYRPPDNRDPSEREKQAFWPYLVRQLDVIKPKLVVTLGRHSMNHFLPNHKISDIHGQSQLVSWNDLLDGQSLMVLPLYHPAAAIYNKKLRDTLLEDFKRINIILN